MSKGAFIRGSVLAAALLWPWLATAQNAGAQTPPPQGNFAPNGIRAGEGRLHPFLEEELRYDSAAGLFGATGEVAPELISHTRPGLRLDVPGNVMAFNLKGDADYVWYTGLLNPGSQFASHLEASAEVGATFNGSGPVSLELSDQFARTDRPTNPAIGVGVLSLFNDARGSLAIRPGGGALEITPGGHYALEFFTPFSSVVPAGCGGNPLCDPTQVSNLNYQNIGATLALRYRFLPKTAIVADVGYDARTYQGGSPNTNLLSATAGLAGLVSPKISVLLKAGYSQNFDPTNQVRTVVGQGELTYFLSETASVKGGYLRTTQPVAVYGVFGDDRGYFEARALLGGRLNLHSYASLDFLKFYSPVAPRTDTTLTVDLGPDYAFEPWLIGTLGYVLTIRSSDSVTATTLNYSRNEGYVRLTFTY